MNSMPTPQKNQTLELKDRHTLSVDSVSDVVSFDEGAVLLRTDLGALTVEGQGLHILALDLEKGRVVIEGQIGGLFYTD